MNLQALGRNLWAYGHSITRPLSTYENTTLKLRTYVHASSGIRTHDPSVRAMHDSTCPKRLRHCDGVN